MSDPLWINAVEGAPEYYARELRRAHAALLYPANEVGGDGRFGARPGVHPSGIDAVELSGSTIQVLDLKAVMDPAISNGQGPYLVQIPAHSHTLDPADASNPRRDVVVLRVYDDDEDASGRREAMTAYLPGSAASSPAEPAVPLGAIRLASIEVPASGTGSPSLTYNAPLTVANGGILPVRDADEIPSGGRYDGMAVWRQDARQLQVRDGGFWWTVGGVPESPQDYTPAIMGHGGGASFDRVSRWYRIYNKTVFWYVQVSVNSAGSGTDNLAITAPTNIDRTVRQIINGQVEYSGGDSISPKLRNAYLQSFTGGESSVWDRIRFDNGEAVLNMQGHDLRAGTLMNFSGIYREA